jgi:hypothetical protein
MVRCGPMVRAGAPLSVSGLSSLRVPPALLASTRSADRCRVIRAIDSGGVPRALRCFRAVRASSSNAGQCWRRGGVVHDRQAPIAEAAADCASEPHTKQRRDSRPDSRARDDGDGHWPYQHRLLRAAPRRLQWTPGAACRCQRGPVCRHDGGFWRWNQRAVQWDTGIADEQRAGRSDGRCRASQPCAQQCFGNRR